MTPLEIGLIISLVLFALITIAQARQVQAKKRDVKNWMDSKTYWYNLWKTTNEEFRDYRNETIDAQLDEKPDRWTDVQEIPVKDYPTAIYFYPNGVTKVEY